MVVSTQKKGETLYCALEGELDHHAAEKVRQELDKLLRDGSVRNMVLDLSQVNFMDSSGIGVLLGRYKTLQKRGGRLALAHVKPAVDRILEMSGIYRVLQRQA